LFLERLSTPSRAPSNAESQLCGDVPDCDRFKFINDSLGHSVGDALLVGIAERLRQQVRSVDSVSSNTTGHTSARLGGDEFVVLLDDIQQPTDAASVAVRLLEALAKPYALGKHEVFSTVSIGIVVGDASYERAEDVVRDADTAMYESKRLGKRRYTIFDASMRERVQATRRLKANCKAIGTSQLSLAYSRSSVDDRRLVSVDAPAGDILRRVRGPVRICAHRRGVDLILTLGNGLNQPPSNGPLAKKLGRSRAP
jgi:diguanylate cyclase (GGDEF)-like protein